jgi:tripartite-type tricarboxylate transporter receptor subunit TctC
MMTSQLTASRFLTALLFIAGLCALAAAQTDFPTAPVRIIVPFAAGGPTDVVTRILGDLLSARWGGKPVVIENRPGAGTIVATEAIAKGTPDGTTVGMATNAFLINPAIEHSLPYDTEKDFAGVSMVATQPVALVANKNFPANTIAELVDYVKKSAEPLNYTSPGPRGVGDLAGKMLEQRAGIKMVHINYNGSAPALTDVIGGRVPIMFDIWHSSQPYVQSGDLKLIASASADRLPGAPNVATIGETYPGYTVMAFQAVIGPAGIPPAILDKFSDDIRAIVSSPEFASRTAKLGIDAWGDSPQELQAWFRQEIARWRELVKTANIKVE